MWLQKYEYNKDDKSMSDEAVVCIFNLQINLK